MAKVASIYINDLTTDLSLKIQRLLADDKTNHSFTVFDTKEDGESTDIWFPVVMDNYSVSQNLARGKLILDTDPLVIEIEVYNPVAIKSLKRHGVESMRLEVNQD